MLPTRNLLNAHAHLTNQWDLDDFTAHVLLGTAMADGHATSWSTGYGAHITYDKDTALFTIKGVTRPQFYVFRSKIPGTMKIWAEYFQDAEGTDSYIHTVMPIAARTKKQAVQLLQEQYPDAFVAPLCLDSDKREARVYVHLFAGRQIPVDFPWEEFEDL